MASALKNLSDFDAEQLPSAADMHFGIAVADWNKEITHALYEGCYDTLVAQGADPEHITTMQVPGAFELPTAARLLIGKGKMDAVICLGCVIKGETDHDVYINQAVANGLVQLSLASGKPCIFGLLTTNTEQQALDRAGGQHGNKGIEAAATAIRMAQLYKENKTGTKASIGFRNE